MEGVTYLELPTPLFPPSRKESRRLYSGVQKFQLNDFHVSKEQFSNDADATSIVTHISSTIRLSARSRFQQAIPKGNNIKTSRGIV
jgi:hypothetical protein